MRGLTAAIVLSVLLSPGVCAWAEEGGKAEGETLGIVKKEVYQYTSGERRDPFLSIVISSGIEKEKEKSEGLLPTQNFDISQMKLMAIVREQASDDYYALVGMPDGKFYTIKKGMPLGLHGGKVSGITLGEVVVSEKIRDYKGRMVLQDTVMRLRTGEEE
jgi:Tfp pilus assembly protein PilP